jgi:hypothetical protein
MIILMFILIIQLERNQMEKIVVVLLKKFRKNRKIKTMRKINFYNLVLE